MLPFRQVDYPSSTFFNLTFATSLLVPLSALLYAIFKRDTIPSDVPRWKICFAHLISKIWAQGDYVLAEQSYHTSSQVSHPCHWDLGGRSSSADHLGKVHRSELRLLDMNSNLFFALRMSSNYCEPPVILHGNFSPSPLGSQLSCHPSFKPSQQGKLTCAWFFGPQGVVDISPIFYEEHPHVIILRSYSTLACVPLGQGQVISPLPTKTSSISGQEGGISVQGDGNREMLFIFFDLMERRARLHMDEEESRHVELPGIDELTA